MENKHARVVISISEGRLELEGDEAFVEKHLAAFKEHVEKSLLKMLTSAKPPSPGGGKPDPSAPLGAAPGLGGYENLFAQADEKIQILKTLPGSSTREKMASAALLTTFAHRLLGTGTIPFDTVRDVCKAHACLDSANFSSTMKSEKQDLLVGGKRGSQTLALTVPGQTRAAMLAASLNVA